MPWLPAGSAREGLFGHCPVRTLPCSDIALFRWRQVRMTPVRALAQTTAAMELLTIGHRYQERVSCTRLSGMRVAVKACGHPSDVPAASVVRCLLDVSSLNLAAPQAPPFLSVAEGTVKKNRIATRLLWSASRSCYVMSRMTPDHCTEVQFLREANTAKIEEWNLCAANRAVCVACLPAVRQRAWLRNRTRGFLARRLPQHASRFILRSLYREPQTRP